MHAVHADSDWVGQRLNARYLVTGAIGRGGMASVYAAVDETLKRMVAVKVPHAFLLDHEGFLERFEREGRSLIELEHPRIVGILDMGSHQGMPFMVMQHLGGGNLADKLEKDPRSRRPRRVAAWLHAIASTLDFMHGKKLLHRDVKPGNILLDTEGHVYLSDFGIVKAVDKADRTLTSTGMLPGAPAYIPPELIQGDELTPAADQYSLAVAAYEALSGRLPFEEKSVLALLESKRSRGPQPLLEIAWDVPPQASRAVMRALSRDPKKRFASCLEFSQAFEEGLGRASVPVWPVAAVVLLVVAAAGLLAVGGDMYLPALATLLVAAAGWLWVLARPLRKDRESGGVRHRRKRVTVPLM